MCSHADDVLVVALDVIMEVPTLDHFSESLCLCVVSKVEGWKDSVGWMNVLKYTAMRKKCQMRMITFL